MHVCNCESSGEEENSAKTSMDTENGRMITFIIKDYIMFQNYLDRCRMKREECQGESREGKLHARFGR